MLNILLPRICLLCRALTTRASHLCAPCEKDLPILSHACLKCAQILHGNTESSLVCGACQQHPPPFDQTFVLLAYEAPVIRLISDLKFQGQLSHAPLFADLLHTQITSKWYAHQPLPDLLLPMPLHPFRLKERGFNQALEIARPLARALRLPLDILGVERIRPTAPQSTLSAVQRARNVANAFRARGSYFGRHVAILDDVMTTGHTLAALAQTLKTAGARQVDVWCCARADLRSTRN